MKPEIPGSTRASRFRASLPACLSLPGRQVPCRAHDLSRSGVLLEGEIPAFPFAEVSLTIESPGGDLQFTTAGRVIRWDEDPQGVASVLGVEFIAVHQDDRPTLEALIARVVEGTSPAALQDLPERATSEQIREALGRIALPHRTALAVRANPKERGILIHDTQPSVIDALARNPGLLPHEAIALLRVPGLMPHTLEFMARDSRWAGNQQVMVMVITHRNTPLAAANQILAKMPRAWVERVIQASGLGSALRTTVLRRLKR